MKTTAKILFFLLIIFSTTSCVLKGTRGNKQVTTKERIANSSFEGIKVSQGINLILTQGNEEEITVETDENLQDILITKVNNNQILEVYFDENVRKATVKNVYVTAKKINNLRSSSGSSIISENAIRSESVQLKSSSGSSIRVEIIATEINSIASSGSSIKIIGKTNNFTAKASSGSTINANRLEASEVTAKASSGSSMEVYASNILNATASSGGSINFDGNPKNQIKNTSSGGSVYKN